MPTKYFTLPSIGSTTQRYSALASPEHPSSPSSAICGNAVKKIRSMSFWQRTSSSSLISWASAEFTCLGRCQLARMIFPAARAAFTAVARASFEEIIFFKSLRNDFVALFQPLQLRDAFFFDELFLGGFNGA